MFQRVTILLDFPDELSGINVSHIIEWPLNPTQFKNRLALLKESESKSIKKSNSQRKDSNILSKTLLLVPSLFTIDLYVLLVDDVAPIRKLYVKFLREFQDRVFLPIECGNGKEACDVFMEKSGQIMAIIMDFQMPVMSGVTATGIIRKSEANKINPPYIVGLSGEEPNNEFTSRDDFDELCNALI